MVLTGARISGLTKLGQHPAPFLELCHLKMGIRFGEVRIAATVFAQEQNKV